MLSGIPHGLLEKNYADALNGKSLPFQPFVMHVMLTSQKASSALNQCGRDGLLRHLRIDVDLLRKKQEGREQKLRQPQATHHRQIRQARLNRTSTVMLLMMAMMAMIGLAMMEMLVEMSCSGTWLLYQRDIQKAGHPMVMLCRLKQMSGSSGYSSHSHLAQQSQNRRCRHR